MMAEWMIRVLNLSFSAGCAALIVMAIRLCLKGLPRGYSYGLWMIVLFRFLCPVTIPASFSLLPVNPEPIRQEIVYEAQPEIETGVIWVDRAVNGSVLKSLAPESAAQSVNPLQIWLALAALIWIAGMVIFAAYHLAQYGKLRRLLADAVPRDKDDDPVVSGSRENHPGKFGFRQVPVYESDRIDGAFVLGVLRPAIYLPAGLSKESRGYILLHEQTHIRRKDPLIKVLGLAAVAIHWFNPLSWLSFRFLCADMEMSCDEQVLRSVGEGKRKDYSQVLLAQARIQSRLYLPLAFGKNHTYQRIKHILYYHKPGTALTVIVVIVLAAVGIGLATSPEKASGGFSIQDKDAAAVSIIGGADGPTSIFVAGKIGGEGEEPVWQRERPESNWLASVRVKKEGFEQENTGAEPTENGVAESDASAGQTSASLITLDYASENSLIFHGDFGLFSFNKEEDGVWRQQMYVKDLKTAEDLAAVLEQVLEENGLEGSGWESKDSIHHEESLKNSGTDSALGALAAQEGGFGQLDYEAKKLADGRIAVLGAVTQGNLEGRLIDLYYGYYDPAEQILHQTYLFLGDGKEIINEKGRVGECRFLFSRDGYDYYFQTPKSLMEFEKTELQMQPEDRYGLPYGRLELARSRDQAEELLDPLMCMQLPEQQKVVLTEERLVYTAAAAADNRNFKNPGLVSIRLDGSDRRTAEILYNVYDGLSYVEMDGEGWLYYTGWTNDSAFPRPLMRMKPDFTGQTEVGELPGDLLEVKDGGVCLYWDWDQMRIMAVAVDKMEYPEEHFRYLADGETADGVETCTVTRPDDYQLLITLASLDPPYSSRRFRLRIPAGRSLK